MKKGDREDGGGGWVLAVGVQRAGVRGRVGDPCGWTVAEATASLSRSIHSTPLHPPPSPPPVRPLHPGHCQSSGSEWIQPAGLRVPPSFSFQCVGRTNIKQFHFQSHPPPPLPQTHPSSSHAGACPPPHGRQINSPDSWSTAQKYNLPFG